MSVSNILYGVEGGGEPKHEHTHFHRGEFTRTATPATPVGNALGDINIDPKLHKGILCYKVCRNGAIVERIITISRSNFIFFVTNVTPQRVPKAMTQYNISSRFKSRLRRSNNKAKITIDSARDPHTNQERSQQSQQYHSPRYLDICDITSVVTSCVTSQKLELCRAKYLGKRKLLSITSLTRNWYKTSKAADLVTRQGGDCIVTIVHGACRDTLDLIIPDGEDKVLFVNALRLILATYDNAKENAPSDELLLRYVWYDYDKGKCGRLNKREMWGVCCRLNVSKTKREFNANFKAFAQKRHADSDSKWKRLRLNYPGLDFRSCLDFLRTHKERSDAWDNTFGRGVESASAEEFLSKFLHEKQRDYDATLNDAFSIIAQLHAGTIGDSPYKMDEGNVKRDCIDRYLFDAYLHSPQNEAYDPECLRFKQSCMDHSLSEFYISSSHNTYLMGDQLKSTSSVQAYSAALQRGCKCLEIDCWDGDGDSIFVYHGYTLTTRISFVDVIACIGQYLDGHPSTYPIILSLEVHCSLAAQRQMAKLLQRQFGKKLYIPKEDDATIRLPSPNALRGMVIIKGKRPQDPESLESASFGDDNDAGERKSDPYDEALVDPSPSPSFNASGGQKKTANSQRSDATSGIAPELARITLFHGCAFQRFEKSLQSSPSHMHSMNEASLNKILSRHPSNEASWKEYNHNHLTRIYPNGSRVDSSNFNPLLSWTLGCQMVSLNFQTPDAPLVVNDCLFRQNGGCGYVLKSKSLRGGNYDLRPSSMLTKIMRTLRMRVVSGSCLPKPNGKSHGECIDPYVRVKVYDVLSNDNSVNGNVAEANGRQNVASSLLPKASSPVLRQIASTHTTRYVLDNGYSPVWRENSWAEFKVSNEMAIVQFSVMDSDYVTDDGIGEAAIPVKFLRPGYRSVSLYDKSGSRSGPYGMASLLIEVDIPRPNLSDAPTGTI